MPHQVTKFSLEGHMEGEAVKAPMREAFSCGQHHWERFLPLIILLNKGWSWSHAACARTVRVQVIFQCTVLFHHAFLGLSRGREIKEYSQYKLSVVKIKSKFFCSLFSCLLVDTVQPIIL